MISLCIIAKNEAKWMRDFLTHLEPIISEIIMIDTGSTDETVEIAETFGAKITKMKWDGDFSRARNLSLSLASKPWILVMDPDERIAGSDLHKIQQLTQSNSIAAYTFITRNYSTNPNTSGYQPSRGEYPDQELTYPGWYESPKIRLFQNHQGIHFVGSVHELVETTVKGETKASIIPIHHYGSDKKAFEDKNKISFYLEQGERKVKESPQDFRAHFELGALYLGIHRNQDALREFRIAHELSPKHISTLMNYGYAALEVKDWILAESLFSKALAMDPDHHDTLLNRGLLEVRKGELRLALKWFTEVLRKHPQSFMAYRLAGICLSEMGEREAARKSYQACLKIFPNFKEAKEELSRLESM